MAIGFASLAALAIVIGLVASSSGADGSPSHRTGPLRPLPTPLYGVTLDDIGNLPLIVQALRRLPHRPTTRIYFDTHQPAAYYAAAVEAMGRVSYLMGELLDSSDEGRITAAAYRSRVRSYLGALANKIDLWEIGNEVNGNWLGPYQNVESKLIAAYDDVSAAHQRTALTLYYNVGCADGPGELDPLAFSRRFVPERIRNGLDVVLLSYYEQNCRGIRPRASTWADYFARLHALYPHARLGFGEIGLTNPVDGATLSYAEGMIRYYYGLAIRLPYYAGGYFWWYCDEDCVPYNTEPLFGALSQGFTAEAAAVPRRP